MSPIEIRYCDIPEYLHIGQFFRSLEKDDPQGVITVPADCLAQDGQVARDLKQFTQLLRTMTFWMLDDIPLEVVSFCFKNDIKVWRDAVLNLPGGDQSTIAKGLIAAFQTPIDFYAVLESAHWEIIEYAVEFLDPETNTHDQNVMEMTAQAAYVGNLRALKLLRQKGFVWTEESCTSAAHNGHLECLQYAHDNGCPWDDQTCKHAMKNGHLHILQYTHQQGLEWPPDVCQWGVVNTHTECLKFAIAHGCPLEDSLCGIACQHGHLECLQLLHQHNAPWDAHTSFCAALHPDVSCLRYLHANGCPWNYGTTSFAALYGHLDSLQYAMSHGCEYKEDEIMVNAAKAGNIRILQYLMEEYRLRVDENEEVFIWALLKGNLQCLTYLMDHGCPYHGTRFSASYIKWNFYDEAFTNNNPDFVDCLRYVIARGWELDVYGIKYLGCRDKENCKEFLFKENGLCVVC